MKNTVSFFILFLVLSLAFAQDCTYEGDSSRWDPQFAFPGVKSGTVHAMEHGMDGYLYLGGIYTAAYGGDIEYNNLVRYDGIKYEELGGGLQCTSCGTGTIYAMTQDELGNIYIGGFFQRAVQNDGSLIQTRNVAKWNILTESWESLGIGLGIDQVNALVWHNDTLFAGGRFGEAFNLDDTLTVNQIAYFLPDSNRWYAMGSGLSDDRSFLDGSVHSLALNHDGTLHVGGAFNFANGISVNSVARWTRLGGWDDWGGGLTQNSSSGSNPAICYELVYDPLTDDLYALGTFGAYSGSSSVPDIRQFARWNADSSSWILIRGLGKAFNSSAWSLNAMFLDTTDRNLYIGGSFFKYTSQFPANVPPGNRIVAYNLNTQSYAELGAGILNGVGPRAIERFQGKIFVAGSFSELNGQNAYNLAAYDGQNWDNLGNGISNNGGGIEEIAGYSDTVIVAGSFSEIDGRPAYRLASFHDSQGWKAIDVGLFANSLSNFNALIYSLEIVGDELWFGGQFAGVADSLNSVGIGRINLQSGTITGFGSGLASTGIPRVTAIEEFQGAVYIAGRFTSIDGIAANSVARYINGNWESIGSIGSGPTDQVYAFYNDGDSVLYLGGRFSEINGILTSNIVAKYDGSNFTPLGMGITGFNNSVRAIARDNNGMIHIGGRITQVKQSDGTSLNTAGSSSLIQWINGRWLDSTQLDLGTGFISIEDLEVDADNTLHFGGQFEQYNGFSDRHIGRWNPETGYLGFAGGITQASGSSVQYPVMSILLTDSFLYMGGKISRVGVYQSQGFARYALEAGLPGTISLNLGYDIENCDSALLVAPSGYSYLWNTGAQNAKLQVFSSGTYAVEVTDNYGCTATDTIEVTIKKARKDIFEADTLYFTGLDTTLSLPQGLVDIRWSDGDSSQTKLFEDGGIYHVSFSDTNGCKGADTIYLEQQIGTSFDILPNSAVKVFPNPSHHRLNIEVQGAAQMELVMWNLEGKVVRRISQTGEKAKLNLTGLSKGIYSMEVITDRGRIWTKFVKE